MGKKPEGDKGGFLKTGQPAKPDEPGEKASKYKRAAQFMVLIGSDEASKILSRLEPDQVEGISKEIVSIKGISSEDAEAVLDEFRSLLSPSYGYSGSSKGGIEEARRLLYAAFGPEKGEALLVKSVPEAAGNLTENPFDFLSDFSGEQLELLFRNESPAACAMVFSRLPPRLSAAALANIRADKKTEIVRRIAKLRETSPEVIERTAAALREKARYFGQDAAVGGEIDGKGVLAAILKHSNLAFGGRLLEEMEESDPSLGREMKDRVNTLEDICNAADRPIQEKLRTMEDREISLLLKGKSDAFTMKVLSNISAARSERVKEESEIMGPVPRVEIEAASREFLAWFRLNREEGRILMLSGEDVLV
ncbi:MAG: flagellar motor switch protein FliG [Treponema sp.]|jgi:flagellar motor switch protein FliG|nr:flagellar motor switch protein FliG [Treponema sp.]